MIMKKDCVNKNGTEYQCDRCKTKVDNTKRILIMTKEPQEVNATKKWDLCPNCYRSLKRGIRKGKQ